MTKFFAYLFLAIGIVGVLSFCVLIYEDLQPCSGYGCLTKGISLFLGLPLLAISAAFIYLSIIFRREK